MPFECYGWCRAQIEDERADEHFPTCSWRCRGLTGTGKACLEQPRCRKTVTWSEQTPTGKAGGLSWRRKKRWTRRVYAYVPSRFLLRYAYELGCCYL